MPTVVNLTRVESVGSWDEWSTEEVHVNFPAGRSNESGAEGLADALQAAGDDAEEAGSAAEPSQHSLNSAPTEIQAQPLPREPRSCGLGVPVAPLSLL